MDELFKDLYKAEHKKNHAYLIVNCILSVLLLISLTACGMLLYELSTYEQVEVVTTTETYEQEIDGDNGSIINGNQYNDSAVHNEGGFVDGEGTTDQN